MNAPVKASEVNSELAAGIKSSLAKAREAVSRILFAARTLEEGALVPLAQRDIADPALAINDALCLIESQLNIERLQWPTFMADPEESEAEDA